MRACFHQAFHLTSLDFSVLVHNVRARVRGSICTHCLLPRMSPGEGIRTGNQAAGPPQWLEVADSEEVLLHPLPAERQVAPVPSQRAISDPPKLADGSLTLDYAYKLPLLERSLAELISQDGRSQGLVLLYSISEQTLNANFM